MFSAGSIDIVELRPIVSIVSSCLFIPESKPTGTLNRKLGIPAPALVPLLINGGTNPPVFIVNSLASDGH
jgi:hypothetical protein